MRFPIRACAVAVACACVAPAHAQQSSASARMSSAGTATPAATHAGGDLGEVVVTAGLRERPLADVPASVAVLDAATLRAAGTQHFEDVLGLVPNLNWSAGSSRPRYFQLRGIGELEQYQGAPNPSVGFLVDDVDFGGLGMVATLYDLERVEVLRGPQGTRYGANALGGLVYVRSRAPEDRFAATADATLGNHDTRALGAVLTGPVAALDSAFRLAVQKYESDGAYRNAWLGRPTDARDELTVRARWRWTPSDVLAVDASLLHAKLANGYDAFSIDNSRTMQSDRPGEDSQRATGASMRATYEGLDGAVLTLIATNADSDSVHAYDGDWGNPRLWSPYTYDFTYRAERERTTRSLEARLASADGAALGWLVGAYAQDLRERIAERSAGAYADPLADFAFDTDDRLGSRYRARSQAVFGQLDGDLAPGLAWSLGLRAERRAARYSDAATSFGAPAGTNAFAPTDRMGGGHASLTWTYARDRSAYFALSRGYKAGGFNPSGALPPERRPYDAEALWNLETGWRAALADGRVRLDATLFYMRRDRLQIRTGEQLVPGDPNTFVFYTGNAPSGHNAGFEGAVRWRASPAFELGGSLGLLRTRFRDLAIDGARVPDRAQPHAPAWQASVDATWRSGTGWFARVDATGSAAYYFDVTPNDTRSDAYALLHARVGWEAAQWSVSGYVRNALDRRYAVRGFYFGNQPPDFADALYVQLGAPREWGLQLQYRLGR